MKQKDHEQLLRDWLTQMMGELDTLRLNVDMLLEDKRFWPETSKTWRKKKVRTK